MSVSTVKLVQPTMPVDSSQPPGLSRILRDGYFLTLLSSSLRMSTISLSCGDLNAPFLPLSSHTAGLIDSDTLCLVPDGHNLNDRDVRERESMV